MILKRESYLSLGFCLLTLTTMAQQKDQQKTDTSKTGNKELQTVKVVAPRSTWTVGLLNNTNGTSIYAGKKNEIVLLANTVANTATNNPRQIFAKVPGVNLIENDAAGVQLSVATRGLNPNRTTEFNSRQNGYDIAADPIGYAETYYTPPTDGLTDVEIIRGAASLQYGTQFGGLLNFKMKSGPQDKKFSLVTKQTAGTYGFFNSFNSVGGQVGKLNYYGFYNFKRGDGWRQNTGFHVHDAYAATKYQLNQKISLGLEYSFMDYVMQQPGGLTDAEFKTNPRQSLRNRNWFSANWNLPALTFEYQMSPNDLLNVKAYALLANRKNVGTLTPITTLDNNKLRTVMNDTYRNEFVEVRYMHHYALFGEERSSLLVGTRYYHGNTHRVQGLNNTGNDANFSIFNGNDAQIDYKFPSNNFAGFVENVFQITSQFSVTPGLRYEHIRTNAVGYTLDTLVGTKVYGNEHHPRDFALLGLGLDYKISNTTDVYGNISQNYSPVSFTDIVIMQSNMKVDPNIKDVKGYNADIGYRGHISDWVSFDLGAYYLLYKNRVGTMLTSDGDANLYLYQTNISDSRSLGSEVYVDMNLLHFIAPQNKDSKLSMFFSGSYTNSKYINTDAATRLKFKNKRVEYAPEWVYRYGVEGKYKNIKLTAQYSYTSFQFADASNSTSSVDGTVGLIPSYGVLDVTANYKWRKMFFSASANNLLNQMYFTRRTTGFPGPGIIPSIGRNMYLTVGLEL